MLIFSHLSRFFGKGRIRRRFVPGRGFTLVELLVVIVIMTILTTVLLFQHRRFDSATLLRSLAYSIALSIRQAQIYGTSVRQFDTTSSGFNYSYGIYFSGQTSYTLFADANGNNSFDSASPNETVQQFNLGTGYKIITLCGINGTVMQCSASCPNPLPIGVVSCNMTGITSLSINFKRPNPDALFKVLPSGGPYSSAYVQIKGPSGSTTIVDNGVTIVTSDTRGITITSTGQISVGALGS